MYADFTFSSLWCTICFSYFDVYYICTRWLFSAVTGVRLQHREHRRQSVCPTPRRGGLRFGTAKHFRAQQAVRRESSRSSQSWQRGEGARTDTLDAPAVTKLTKPDDPPQVQVEPVMQCPKENKAIQIFGGHMPNAQCSGGKKKIVCDFTWFQWPKTPLVACVFTWFQYMTVFCSN